VIWSNVSCFDDCGPLRNLRDRCSECATSVALAQRAEIYSPTPEGDAARRAIGERLVEENEKTWQPVGVHLGYIYHPSPIVVPDGSPMPDWNATMETLVLILDLVGTFVFALSGATAAVNRRFDIFGVLVLSFAAGNARRNGRFTLILSVPHMQEKLARAAGPAAAGRRPSDVGASRATNGRVTR
jgi:hypothetical protein